MQLFLSRFERGPHGGPRLPDPLAGLGPRLRREGTDLAVGERERRPVAGVGEPHLLQLVEVVRPPAMAARAVVDGRLHLVRVQRRHLDRVERRVGGGHACVDSSTGAVAAARV